MTSEDVSNKILEYLKKEGHANTFKLARKLAIDRHEILTTLQDLQLKGAIEFRSGTATFLKSSEARKQEKGIKESAKKAPVLPIKETKVKKVKIRKYTPKKTSSKKTPVFGIVLKALQEENDKLKKRLIKLETKLEEHTKESHVKKLDKPIKKRIKKKKVIAKKQKKFKKPIARKKVKKSKFKWLKNLQKVQVPKFIAKKKR